MGREVEKRLRDGAMKTILRKGLGWGVIVLLDRLVFWLYQQHLPEGSFGNLLAVAGVIALFLLALELLFGIFAKDARTPRYRFEIIVFALVMMFWGYARESTFRSMDHDGGVSSVIVMMFCGVSAIVKMLILVIVLGYCRLPAPLYDLSKRFAVIAALLFCIFFVFSPWPDYGDFVIDVLNIYLLLVLAAGLKNNPQKRFVPELAESDANENLK